MFDKKLPRRDFLRISSAVVAGTAAASLIPGKPLFGAASTSGLLPVMSIGYVDHTPDASSSAYLRSANEISSGDPAFLSRRLSMTISNFSRHEKFRGTGSGYEVDAIFPANSYTPEKYPRFRSWLTVDKGDGDAAAAGAHFSMPVTSTDGAQLIVRRLNADANTNNQPAEQSLLRFSTGVESDTIKLQPGIYVLALREAGREDAPKWGSLKLVNSNNVLSIPNATFSYLLITINYGD